jgi:hypothetical protein
MKIKGKKLRLLWFFGVPLVVAITAIVVYSQPAPANPTITVYKSPT